MERTYFNPDRYKTLDDESLVAMASFYGGISAGHVLLGDEELAYNYATSAAGAAHDLQQRSEQ